MLLCLKMNATEKLRLKTQRFDTLLNRDDGGLSPDTYLHLNKNKRSLVSV